MASVPQVQTPSPVPASEGTFQWFEGSFAPRQEARGLFVLIRRNASSEKQIIAYTKDLNLFGCFVEIGTPFPEGTKVRLRISRGDTNVVGTGRVAYSRPRSGMGIHFTTIDLSSLPVLDRWLANLKE